MPGSVVLQRPEAGGTNAGPWTARSMKPAMSARVTTPVGEIIRRQRELSELSMRQFADLVGISNPYMSQIERGLRKPSAEVLQQIAKALRISAEQLYVRAGIVHPDPGQAGSVELAVLADRGLTERQKQSLLDVYASFLALNDRDSQPTQD